MAGDDGTADPAGRGPDGQLPPAGRARYGGDARLRWTGVRSALRVVELVALFGHHEHLAMALGALVAVGDAIVGSGKS